jgi:hypothetical protein
MNSQTDFVHPPRVAVWLVTLFTPAQQAEPILGDLMEEFSHLASISGIAIARDWYWRQAVKTSAYLAGSAFRTAPWSAAAAVVGGSLLIRFGLGLYGQAFNAVLDSYRVYEYLSGLGSQQPSLNIGAAYMFWITRGMLIGRLLVETLAGGIVAVAAKEREITATLALGLFMSALGVIGCLMMVASTGNYAFLFSWALPWVFADSIAVVVGGAIVRTCRSAVTMRPSAT